MKWQGRKLVDILRVIITLPEIGLKGMIREEEAVRSNEEENDMRTESAAIIPF